MQCLPVKSNHYQEIDCQTGFLKTSTCQETTLGVETFGLPAISLTPSVNMERRIGSGIMLKTKAKKINLLSYINKSYSLSLSSLGYLVRSAAR